jgi:ABC-type phosphate transport system substrate-binding protein
MGSEEIFAGWLTDGQASSLDSYTATPDGVTMVDARDDRETYAIVSSTPGAIGFVNWLYVSEKDPALSHVNVLPVRNRINGNTQVPGDDKVVTEINNLNNENYDSGLVSQLFYVTDRTPSAIAEDYINYAMSPDAIPLYRQAGAYSIFELKA